jgi:hypothetical protein
MTNCTANMMMTEMCMRTMYMCMPCRAHCPKQLPIRHIAG